MQTIRIFISSPGDVAREREVAAKVIERLQGKYWSFARLDDVFWEGQVVRATRHHQLEIPQPGECEIVAGILWSRLGSPLPGQFRRRDGERWESGTEWELEQAFEAYDRDLERLGDPVRAKPDIVVYRRTVRRVPLSDPVEEAEAVEQEAKLDRYLREQFAHPDGTIRRPVTLYGSVEEFERKLAGDLDQLVLRLIPSLPPGFEPPPISGSPFLDLRAFDFEDRNRYFGRLREIRQVRELLRRRAAPEVACPFVLIYGGSGYGKSSLMRAGLAPAVTRPGGGLPGMDQWRRALLQPASGDGMLLDRLVRVLRAAVPEIAGSDAVADLSETLGRLNVWLFLQIDQLEEVFATLPTTPAEREAFFVALADLCEGGRVWVAATLRSEYFPRVADEPVLRELIGENGGYILPPPDGHALREIIRYPAAAARLGFERSMEARLIGGVTARHDWLDRQILSEAEGSPDALPLLEFTLRRLYAADIEGHADANATTGPRLLRWDTYCAFGGLKGAIADTADHVYRGLGPAGVAVRGVLFSALVRVDAAGGGMVVRRPADLAALRRLRGASGFLDAFIGARLLVTDAPEGGGTPVVTLAHEALITHWPVLRDWVGEHRGDLLARQRLAEATALWLENGKAKRYLLAEGRLAEARAVAANPIFSVTGAEADFLRRSHLAARRRARAIKATAVVFALLAAGAGTLGWLADHRARETLRVLSRADFEFGTETVEKGRSAEGAAYLARALRNDSANAAAARRVYTLLAHRTHLLPHCLPIRTGSAIAGFEHSPDGSRLLISTVKERLQIYDSATGREIGPGFWPPNQTPNGARFLGDGEILTLGGKIGGEGTDDRAAFPLVIQRWIPGTWEPVGDAIETGVDWNFPKMTVERGTRIVAIHDSGGTELLSWNIDTGKPAGPPIRVGKPISHVALAPNGTLAVVIEEREALNVFRLETGERDGEPVRQGEETKYEDFRFVFDGAFALLSGRNQEGKRMWSLQNAATGEQAGFWMDEDWALREAALDEAALTMAAVGTDGFLHRISMRGIGQKLSEPVPHQGIAPPLVHPGARQVVTQPDERTISLRTLAPSVPGGRTLLATRGALMAVPSPDSAHVLTADLSSNVTLFRTSDGQSTGRVVKHSETIHWLGFSPDGTTAASADLEGTINVFPVADSKGEIWTFQAGGKLPRVAFDPTGRFLLVSADNCRVTLWNRTTRAATPTAAGLGILGGFGFLSGGREFYFARGKEVEIWRVEPPGMARSFRAAPDVANLTVAAADPEGRRLATACPDSGIDIWDLTHDDRNLLRIPTREAPRMLAFSPNGDHVLAMSANEIRVWETATGREAAPALRLRGLKRATFSPDGETLLTTHGTIARLWDWRTGRPISDELATAFEASFSGDGHHFLRGEMFVCQLASIPPATEPPPWLAELGECVFQRRLREDGILEAVPGDAWPDLRGRLAALPGDDFWSAFGRWFASDPWERPLTATDSTGTTSEFLQFQAAETLEIMRESEGK